MSDIELEKHAKEYHGLTLNQFKLMCNEADKRYEGQFANSVDKHLAVECFYEGFKVAISGAPSWQGLSDDEINDIKTKTIMGANGMSVEQLLGLIVSLTEQTLRNKNGY